MKYVKWTLYAFLAAPLVAAAFAMLWFMGMHLWQADWTDRIAFLWAFSATGFVLAHWMRLQ